ncbi:MAG: hypothetical protein H0V97_00165 [Actinobacteria bacterium]|nr:hypothetical protein [Actinomycetota bacterium]
MLDPSIYFEKADEPHVRPRRPLAPGDIFRGVPLAWVPKHKDPFEQSAAKAPQKTVMLLGHPCAIYGGGRPATCLTIAEVRPKAQACGDRSFDAPWAGFSYLFPLPLLSENEDYVVDFRRVGSVHYKYLEDSRVACLTHEGWAYLHQRYAFHTGRVDLEFDESFDSMEEYWNEFELWERWNESREPAEFQEWLKGESTSAAYPGTNRQELLKFAPDELLAEMLAMGEGNS